MLLRSAQFAVLLVFVDISLAGIHNDTIKNVTNKLDVEAINKKLGVEIETRRKKSRHRSTSSSSGEKRSSKSKSGEKESLDFSSESSSSSSTDGKKSKRKGDRPKSSAERRGWRKWHRKCTPCPEEMNLKWRDPRIEWICGAYQRARRSFKSMCMMHFRNCQDGTMFTKIADHRCDNRSRDVRPFGQHFFYDYKVRLSGDSSSSSKSEETSSLTDED